MTEEVWDQDDSTTINKDAKIHMDHLYQDGFRTGVAKGQEESVQAGFDIGYLEGMKKGREWGFCQGISTTLNALKGKDQMARILPELEDVEVKMKELSSRDAYISHYNQLVNEKINEFKQQEGHQVIPELLDDSQCKEDTQQVIQEIKAAINEKFPT